ncbi:MAG: V4R domain-containing protein [Polyangiaceae bacterium]
MLELDPQMPPPSSSFDPARIDEKPDSEIDALPFGVIALDAAGTILRFNLYESRLARLDRNQTLGRNFFREVAPCTRTETFEGRAMRLLSHGAVGETESFEYVFAFAFGEQHVKVEMFVPSPGRLYLFINRKSIRKTRMLGDDVPLAVEQRALAPDERSLGVRRDELERRAVDVPAPFFAALRATCDRVAPESWQLFASEWGVQWGRRVAIDLEAWATEQGEPALREIPMRRVAELVSRYFSDRGWGMPLFDFGRAAEGIVAISVERSALAETSSSARIGRGQELSCHLLAGSFSGVFTYLGNRRLAVREVACRSAGEPVCSFVVVSHDRRTTVDKALRAGARGIESIQNALRRTPS